MCSNDHCMLLLTVQPFIILCFQNFQKQTLPPFDNPLHCNALVLSAPFLVHLKYSVGNVLYLSVINM